MAEVWAFLSDPANQATLTWLGGGLATVAGAAWAVIRYFMSRREEQPAKSARSTVRTTGKRALAMRSSTAAMPSVDIGSTPVTRPTAFV